MTTQRWLPSAET